MQKYSLPAFSLVMVVIMLIIAGCSASPASQEPEQVIIGYIGNVSSPGTRPCMDFMQIAVDDINAAGGILGKRTKLVIEDGRGETTSSVAAAQRLLMRYKPVVYYIEGRSEIALAIREKSADLFPSFPHISIVNGATDWELTAGIVSQYDRYKFFFRDFEWAQYPWYYNLGLRLLKDSVKAKKLAFLYEDLVWTKLYREGGGPGNMPSMKEYAEKQGFEVVYDKAIKPRSGMWLPVFETIARSGADAIFVLSSWYTDTEVMAKQWADSSARDIPILAEGGTICNRTFWEMTNGKCLGLLTSYQDDDSIAVTPMYIPLIQKAHAKNIPLQFHVISAYNDVLGLKVAMETAGTTSDVNALIKELERGEPWEGVTGPASFNSERVEPWFHSGKVTSMKNLLEVAYPDRFHIPLNQWQGKDKVPLLLTWPGFMKYANPDAYKSPAQLRAEAASGK
ncbi:MAG: ABC transporter substrate-binding protein [Chloroflexi bacterium]|nr:ABC transporter substrate-binding protein [Chloroflexota bacterium]